ncbi:MAG TPA: nucleoside hydrolase [Ilumatobacteraceae bacterium]|nr:nucleoside hydrolase [Ilumatobacteraceae bacterium]
MDRRSIVIDTDTASDDAVALLLAVREPSVDVRAVTVVAGNVPLDLAVRNAIVTLDLCGGSDIDVHAGRDRPLARPLDTAQFVHGQDGMGGAALPEPSRPATSDDAVGALLEIARTEEGRHDLVTLGPLTNVAAALERDPDLLTRFGHTYLMAGSPDGVGNVDSLGEYNVWADPEAATAVFAAQGPKTMIGWNISRRFAVVHPDEQTQLAQVGPLGRFVIDINGDVEQYCLDTGLDGFDLPDPVAMAVALDDVIVTESTDEWLVVGLDGPTRGCTIPDRRFGRPDPNIRVVWTVDEAAFKQRLFTACSA